MQAAKNQWEGKSYAFQTRRTCFIHNHLACQEFMKIGSAGGGGRCKNDIAIEINGELLRPT
jgi:hypothetical protein